QGGDQRAGDLQELKAPRCHRARLLWGAVGRGVVRAARRLFHSATASMPMTNINATPARPPTSAHRLTCKMALLAAARLGTGNTRTHNRLTSEATNCTTG